jgi:hypothetical protein
MGFKYHQINSPDSANSQQTHGDAWTTGLLSWFVGTISPDEYHLFGYIMIVKAARG